MLDQPLSSATPATELKKQIAAAFWDTATSEVTPCLEPYFQFYTQQCQRIALHEGGSHVSCKRHQDVVAVVQLLREGRTREEIGHALSSASNNAALKRDYSIDLAARLLLMVEFGNLPFVYTGFRQLEWTGGSLQDFVFAWFDKKQSLGHENIRLGKIFTSRNLDKIAGIEIIWTTNLADHLRLMKDDKAVAVFHHASFLKRQERDSSLYSKEFIAETLSTLALLFPKWDSNTRTWYQHEASLKGSIRI